jgi:hypothetical protein
MGAWGAIIMGFFGALFAALTMFWQFRVQGIALAGPFVISAAIAYVAANVLRSPGEGIVPSSRVERAITWSSVGEGLGLFIAANLVTNIHRPDLLLPAMALVVGLHFLPIGFVAEFIPFYALGAALIISAMMGFLIEAPTGGAIAGFMATGGLWIAAGLALRRDRRAKLASCGSA